MAEEDLLHPRKVWVRKNVLKGDRLTDKPPSKALIRLYGGYVQAAIVAVLFQPPRSDNVAKKNKIEVSFPKKHKFPEGWPIGRIVKELDGIVTRAYNAELIVLWGYQYLYCKWQPSDLYKHRGPVMHGMASLERNLEITLDEGVEEEYNSSVETDNEGE